MLSVQLSELVMRHRVIVNLNYFLILFLPAILSLTSCEYELKSENLQNIAVPDTSKRILVQLSASDTSYNITRPTDFFYDLHTFGLNVYDVAFFLDNVLLFRGDEQKATFQIFPEYFEPGEKTLTMVVTTSSNTGSLADLMGWEGLVFSKEWKMYVCGLNQGAVLLSRIYNDDGLLKLEWVRYNEVNFQKYKVWVNYTDYTYTDQDSYLIGEITNQDQTFFHDSTFIGGNPRYWIEVEASDQSVKGNEVRYNYTPPTLEVLWTRNDSALFHWKKNSFYRALDEYRLYTPSNAYPYNQEVVFSSFNADDTTCILRKLRFGDAVNYQLWQFARKEVSPAHGNSVHSECAVSLGTVIPRFHSAIGIHNKPVLYLMYYDRITKTSIPDGTELLKFDTDNSDQWSVLPNDNYIFTWNGGMKIKHDSQNFGVLNEIAYPWSYMPSPEAISLSCRATIWLDDGIAMYDFINDRYIFTGKNKGLPGAVISPDGKYAFTRQWLHDQVFNLTVHQVTDTGLVEIWSLPAGKYAFVKWMQEDYSKLIVLEGPESAPPPLNWTDNIRIFDPGDETVLYELNVRIGYLAGITPESGKVAMWDQMPGMDDKNKVYLYDYRSGILSSEINLAPRFDNLILYKTFLISGKGYCLDISGF